MKTQKRVKTVKQRNSAPLATQEVKAAPTPSLPVVEVEPAPPDMVLQDALGEPDRRLLEEYGDSIRVLRDDKRFTFREIAEWLQEYGIDCDHNSVYREYTKGLSFEEERDVAYRDAMEEEERP
jgi:hypothetical protein